MGIHETVWRAGLWTAERDRRRVADPASHTLKSIEIMNARRATQSKAVSPQRSAKSAPPLSKKKAKPRAKVASPAATKQSGKAKAEPSAKRVPKPKPKAAATAKRKSASKPASNSGRVPKRNAPPVLTKKARSATGVASEALKARAMKKVIADVIAPEPTGRSVVDAYLRDLDHPFKAEMEAVRSIILGASNKIAERIKWNAPSFYYKEDLAAFNLRASEFAHLILLFPDGVGMPAKSPLLEGKHKDRREAKFHSLSDVEAKKPALERLVKSWVKQRDA